jgi:hypothetical protein
MFRITDYVNGNPLIVYYGGNIDSARRYLACAIRLYRKCGARVIALGNLCYQTKIFGLNVRLNAERVK